MSIKYKLFLGLAFLFAMLVLMGGLGSYFIRQLSADSEAIIQDNYRTLNYVRQMNAALEEMQAWQTTRFFQDSTLIQDNGYRKAQTTFDTFLKEQEANITEIGESELTASIREDFMELIKETADNQNATYFTEIAPTFDGLRRQLDQLYQLNEQGVLRKNTVALQTAKRGQAYVAIIGTLSIMVALGFLFTFPGYVANPIRKLNESIKQIANQNYSQRLDFSSNDEFGELADSFNRMAKKLDAYQHSKISELLYEKKRNQAIINQLSDAIIGLDAGKYILFTNPAATRLLGLPETELAGKYAPDVAAHNDLMRSLIGELMIDFEPWEKREFKPLKIVVDGKESYFSKDLVDVSATPTGEETNILIGHVILLRNITQFREIDAAKTNFIATISHELKTPIASIRMSLKLLEDKRVGAVNEEQQRLIANVKEESTRLLKITGELLDLAQVETGNIQLHFQPVNPKEVIQYAQEAVRVSAAQKNITFEIHAADDLPAVQADLEKTVWVMINLLGNAIRHSPENKPVVIQLRQTGENVAFSVRDYGKGISPQYQERIFEKFFQVPNNGQSQGTGLGLAISKEFIAAQYGKIWVESKVDEGSTFTFTLPVV